jgi:tRNA uridine 5-carboxymethylaminomethyl modification enzyme
MTSRAEYRLALRQDNADLRLTEKGFSIGLADARRYQRFQASKADTEREIKRLRAAEVFPGDAAAFLRKYESAPLQNKSTLAELLKRPEIDYEKLAEIDADRPALSKHVRTQVEIQIKYEGYIHKQAAQIAHFKKLETKRIPEDIVYASLDGLRMEARQKLGQVRPISIGQASRIPGVSPADVNVLLIHLEKRRRQTAASAPPTPAPAPERAKR